MHFLLSSYLRIVYDIIFEERRDKNEIGIMY